MKAQVKPTNFHIRLIHVLCIACLYLAILAWWPFDPVGPLPGYERVESKKTGFFQSLEYHAIYTKNDSDFEVASLESAGFEHTFSCEWVYFKDDLIEFDFTRSIAKQRGVKGEWCDLFQFDDGHKDIHLLRSQDHKLIFVYVMP